MFANILSLIARLLASPASHEQRSIKYGKRLGAERSAAVSLPLRPPFAGTERDNPATRG